ncbi:MAG TPA: hypothetical protein VFV92_02810, partial [Candidatus Bathyarchaeia archaeon]|nr:hypothetical protein [Candidatus Bathyarchaeia archaeon]
MKKFLLFCAVLVFVVLFVASMSGCGTSAVLPTPTPTPTQTPTPTPSPSETSNLFASLRTDGTTSSVAAPMTRQQSQAARRAAKFAHATRQQITADSGPVNVYVWPASLNTDGTWSLGSERKITDNPAAYTAVHLSFNGTNFVFSAIVNGYNQIFTSTVPAVGQTVGEPLQLTTDLEHHWVPHIYSDGSMVVFT